MIVLEGFLAQHHVEAAGQRRHHEIDRAGFRQLEFNRNRPMSGGPA